MTVQREQFRIEGDDGTKAMFAAIGSSLKRLEQQGQSVGEVFGRLAGVAGVGIGFGALAQQIKAVVDQADGLNKLSQRTGIAAEALSELSYAAKLSDVDNEALGDSLRKLATRMADAAAGGREQQAIFKAVGVSVQDASGKLRSTDDVLSDLADRFAEFADGPEKSALAVEIFGKSGDRLIPMLNSLRKLREEGRELGAVYSGEMARAAEEFNDNLTRLASVAERAKVELAGGLLPGLTKFLDEMIEGTRIAGGFLNALYVFGTIDPFKDVAGNIRDVTRAMQENEAELARSGLFGPNFLRRAQLEGANELLAKQKAFLQYQQRQKALEDARALGDIRDARDRQLTDRPLRTAPVIERPAGAGAREGGRSGYETAIEGLERERDKVSELTRAQEVLAEIERGRYGTLNAAQRERLLGLAGEVDNIKEAKELREALATSERAVWQQRAQEDKQLRDLAARYEDLADPLQKYRRQLEEIDQLESRGDLSRSIAAGARARVNEQLAEAADRMRGIKEETDTAGAAFREFGVTMSSSLEDFITKGGEARDLIRAIGEDILRFIVRRNITDPIASSISKFDFSSLFRSTQPFYGGGGIAAPFAEGGIMTPQGPLPLRRYSRGGVARSPQLAMFGEGDMAEAYVPLPDGRSIPVQFRNSSPDLAGGRPVSVTVNVHGAGEAQARARASGDGSEISIDLFIDQVDDALADRARTGRGQLAGAMQDTFGLSRVPGMVR